MNKTIKMHIFAASLIILISNIALGSFANKIILNRLDFNRIEAKQKYYNLFVERAKKFRKVVYVTGATTVAGLVAYLSFKAWEKFHEDDATKSSSSNNTSKKRTLGNETADFVAGIFSSKKIKELKRGLWQDVSMKERCKIGLLDGISDGFYYGTIGIVASSFLAVKTKLFGTVADKVTKRWRIKDEDLFWDARNSLNIYLSQMRSFFENDAKFYDKEEFKENYKVFIYALENFMALILANIPQALTPDQPEYQSIANLQNILCQKVIGFSDELEVELNSNEIDNFENGISNSLFNSFKQLNNQIIRFVNLCHSVVYGG